MKPIQANGLLFIGDLHISSRAPSRRRDDYVEAIFRKLSQTIDIANDRCLVPVILGDVFHRPREPSETIKTRLLRLFGSCWTSVLSNVGNHDKQGLVLDDGDTLSVIAEPGAPFAICTRSGPMAVVEIDNTRIGLGMTPYGEDIPHDVTGAFGGVDYTVWVTHHDIGFEGAYPGAIEPHPIAGCNMVVNGHMHAEKHPVQTEDTHWYNFGSLARTAIDAVNHEPCVWSMTIDGLSRHRLEFDRDVFDMASRLLDEVSPGELTHTRHDSAFIDMLRVAQNDGETSRSSDGQDLMTMIISRIKATGGDDDVVALAMDLHTRAMTKRDFAP